MPELRSGSVFLCLLLIAALRCDCEEVRLTLGSRLTELGELTIKGGIESSRVSLHGCLVRDPDGVEGISFACINPYVSFGVLSPAGAVAELARTGGYGTCEVVPGRSSPLVMDTESAVSERFGWMLHLAPAPVDVFVFRNGLMRHAGIYVAADDGRDMSVRAAVAASLLDVSGLDTDWIADQAPVLSDRSLHASAEATWRTETVSAQATACLSAGLLDPPGVRLAGRLAIRAAAISVSTLIGYTGAEFCNLDGARTPESGCIAVHCALSPIPAASFSGGYSLTLFRLPPLPQVVRRTSEQIELGADLSVGRFSFSAAGSASFDWLPQGVLLVDAVAQASARFAAGSWSSGATGQWTMTDTTDTACRIDLDFEWTVRRCSLSLALGSTIAGSGWEPAGRAELSFEREGTKAFIRLACLPGEAEAEDGLQARKLFGWLTVSLGWESRSTVERGHSDRM